MARHKVWGTATPWGTVWFRSRRARDRNLRLQREFAIGHYQWPAEEVPASFYPRSRYIDDLTDTSDMEFFGEEKQGNESEPDFYDPV